jgi:hypothetical protein
MVSLHVRVCVCFVDVGVGVGGRYTLCVVAVGDRCCKMGQIKTYLWQRGWVHCISPRLLPMSAVVAVALLVLKVRLRHADVSQHLGDEITEQKWVIYTTCRTHLFYEKPTETRTGHKIRVNHHVHDSE